MVQSDAGDDDPGEPPDPSQFHPPPDLTPSLPPSPSHDLQPVSFEDLPGAASLSLVVVVVFLLQLLSGRAHGMALGPG